MNDKANYSFRELPQASDPRVAVALIEALRAIHAIGKGSRNTQQGFSFRGIDEVLNEVGPVLREVGIIPIPHVRNVDPRERESKGGARLLHYLVEVQYTFLAADGSREVAIVYGEAMDAGDKGLAKAMSVALRILLLQMFAIPTGDPDPDSSSYELGSGQTFSSGTRTVSEIRSKIVQEMGRSNPAWTLEQIAEDFKARQGVAITEASVDDLADYLKAVSE